MANQNIQMNPMDSYQYIDEESIDVELRCSLCMQPFVLPTSGKCGHTYCKQCIEPWVNQQSTCPTCRVEISKSELHLISTRIVLNQLDRLIMQCKRCKQINIQRGDINQHEEQCIDQTISCTAFDIKCTWKGTRKTLAQHLQECPFEKIRPAIDDIYESLRNVYEPLINEVQTIRQQLKQQVQRNRKQNHFLLAVFNKGKPMSVSPGCSDKRCYLKESFRGWRGNQHAEHQRALCEQELAMMERSMANNRNYNQSPQSQKKQPVQDRPTSTSFLCASCHNDIDFNNMALHHCEGGCICKTCVQMYGSLDMN